MGLPNEGGDRQIGDRPQRRHQFHSFCRLIVTPTRRAARATSDQQADTYSHPVHQGVIDLEALEFEGYAPRSPLHGVLRAPEEIGGLEWIAESTSLGR